MAALTVTLATQDRYPFTTEKIGHIYRKVRFSHVDNPLSLLHTLPFRGDRVPCRTATVYSLSLLHPGLSLYTCMHLLRFPFVVLPLTKWNLAVLGLKLN